MFTLGIILARAGSRGLPGKCTRPLLGRPLIEYTFEHAQAARRLDAVVLTTDSPHAMRLAASWGIPIVFRPADLATDTAPVDAAARHAVENFEHDTSRTIDAAVLLYGNVPVRAEGVIDRAIEKLEQTGADSVRTVVPVGRHHPDWLHRLHGDRMEPLKTNHAYRRQDLEPLYYHDGAVVAVRREPLFAAADHPDDHQAFLGHDRRALIQQPTDAVDVDDPFDLLVAEALLRARMATADCAL